MKQNSSNGLIKKEEANPQFASLYTRVIDHIDRARQTIQKSIDTEIIKAYWLIGRELQIKYKRGFSVDVLEQAQRFYLIYQLKQDSQISDAVCRKLQVPKFNPKLSWTHY